MKFFYYYMMVSIVIGSMPCRAEKTGLFERLCKKKNITLGKVLSFGNEGNKNEILFRPSDFCFTASGDFLVLDRQECNIKRFDRKGKFRAVYSRKGQGPGEIMFAKTMAIAPDGNIFVHDFISDRLTVFSNNGDYLESMHYKNKLNRFICVSDSIIIMEQLLFKKPKQNILQSEKPVTGLVEYKISAFNTNTELSYGIDSCLVKLLLYIPGGLLIAKPLQPELLWGEQPSGHIVIVNSDINEGFIYSQDRKKVGSFSLQLERCKVKIQDRKKYFDSASTGRLSVSFLKKHIKFPDVKPYCTALFIDAQGNILLQGYENKIGLFKYYVYSPKGRKIGSFLMPYLSKHAVFKGKYIYDISKTDEGYPCIVKYKVKI